MQKKFEEIRSLPSPILGEQEDLKIQQLRDEEGKTTRVDRQKEDLGFPILASDVFMILFWCLLTVSSGQDLCSVLLHVYSATGTLAGPAGLWCSGGSPSSAVGSQRFMDLLSPHVCVSRTAGSVVTETP